MNSSVNRGVNGRPYGHHRNILLDISRSLKPNELKEMVFLCSDFLSEDQQQVSKEDAKEFLMQLEKLKMLGTNNWGTLIGLLKDVKRIDLIDLIESFQPQNQSTMSGNLLLSSINDMKHRDGVKKMAIKPPQMRGICVSSGSESERSNKMAQYKRVQSIAAASSDADMCEVNNEKRNFFRLFLLLVTVGNRYLRIYFKIAWNLTTGRHWTDCPRDANDLMNLWNPKILSYEMDKVSSGDTSTWDLSLLVKIIGSYVRLNVLLEGTRKALEYIKEMRNNLCHTPNSRISNSDFKKQWEDTCNVLTVFGAKSEDFDCAERDAEQPLPVLISILVNCLAQENELLRLELEKSNLLTEWQLAIESNQLEMYHKLLSVQKNQKMLQQGQSKILQGISRLQNENVERNGLSDQTSILEDNPNPAQRFKIGKQTSACGRMLHNAEITTRVIGKANEWDSKFFLEEIHSDDSDDA